MGDEPDLVLGVLHGLRLSGFASIDVVTARLGVDEAVVRAELERCREHGWVTYREGRLTGWMLSADGRAEGERRLARELDAVGARGLAESSYETFLPLNAEFLALCTDWQLREVDGQQVLNDHLDPAHDATVLGRLEELHPQVAVILDRLGDAVPRFASYRARLDHALERVRAADTDWLTKPVIDSYHTVWFELHEDLLATLGRHRSSEPRP